MKSTFNICFYAKKDKQKANGASPPPPRPYYSGRRGEPF